jgi:hypothetical protein
LAVNRFSNRPSPFQTSVARNKPIGYGVPFKNEVAMVRCGTGGAWAGIFALLSLGLLGCGQVQSPFLRPSPPEHVASTVSNTAFQCAELTGSADTEAADPGAPSGEEVQRIATPGPTVWGIAGIRGYPCGERTGPNGVEYSQLFALNLDLNIWFWRKQGVYGFSEATFWGQKPGTGVTNPSQGVFDFSKREFDFNLGAAWNYLGNFEARVFAYSFNNLNRGKSLASPAGFNDGIGLENRYYLGAAYADLGTTEFDQARAAFLSVGYYPTKDMVDVEGNLFKPGPFARAYLTFEPFSSWWYLFADVELIGERTFTPKLLLSDGGVAVRPWASHPRLEFRLGLENLWDIPNHEAKDSFYGAVRYVF